MRQKLGKTKLLTRIIQHLVQQSILQQFKAYAECFGYDMFSVQVCEWEQRTKVILKCLHQCSFKKIGYDHFISA